MTAGGQPESARHVCSSFHGAWDRDLEPALEVEDGELVELHVPDASRDQIGEAAVAADLASVDFDLMNPVAGPVFVRGARPAMCSKSRCSKCGRRPGAGRPSFRGSGSSPTTSRRRGYASRASRTGECSSATGSNYRVGHSRARSASPGKPGAALGHPSPHDSAATSTYGTSQRERHFPARRRRRRAVLRGRRHAAQGDGEVCGSAIETGMEILLRLGVKRDIQIGAPQLLVPTVTPPVPGSVHITTGIGENLHEAARGAARAMIDLSPAASGSPPRRPTC